MFIDPKTLCNAEYDKFLASARFKTPPTEEDKAVYLKDCIVRRELSRNSPFNRPIKVGDMFGVSDIAKDFIDREKELGKPVFTKPIPAIRPKPPIIMPKPQLQPIPENTKKETKIDTNQLLLLGMGAIIVILILKK